MKKGILLINLGTPDSPKVADVRKYLREFLMDKYVIDIPFFPRWLLVNLIIAPFRGPKSAKIYQQLWTEHGSPLLYYGQQVTQLLQQELKDEYKVVFAMRYQNPSIKKALKYFKDHNICDLKVIPLYPQYASSTTKSSIEKVKQELKKLNFHPQINFIDSFLTNSLFIETFAEQGKKYLTTGNYDKVVFSYHGVPERHILKDCTNGYCKLDDECCAIYTDKNKFCYRAGCYETSRRLAKAMNLSDNEYDVIFQSRLETRAKDPWLTPYADLKIAAYPKSGIKKVLIFSPSFVADCLETTIEVGSEFAEIFKKNGGELWLLVESLNDHPKWIKALVDLVSVNK